MRVVEEYVARRDELQTTVRGLQASKLSGDPSCRVLDRSLQGVVPVKFVVLLTRGLL